MRLGIIIYTRMFIDRKKIVCRKSEDGIYVYVKGPAHFTLITEIIIILIIIMCVITFGLHEVPY